jgi:hypothetical protein
MDFLRSYSSSGVCDLKYSGSITHIFRKNSPRARGFKPYEKILRVYSSSPVSTHTMRETAETSIFELCHKFSSADGASVDRQRLEHHHTERYIQDRGYAYGFQKRCNIVKNHTHVLGYLWSARCFSGLPCKASRDWTSFSACWRDFPIYVSSTLIRCEI